MKCASDWSLAGELLKAEHGVEYEDDAEEVDHWSDDGNRCDQCLSHQSCVKYSVSVSPGSKL